MKTYRNYEPDQPLLFQQDARDWLPKDHLVYFLGDVVDDLNIAAITSVYEREGRGYPPYHPRLMVKILLYAYSLGLRSSRKIQRALHEDVAFRILAANNFPDFRTISDFRKKHRKSLAGLFGQVLTLCKMYGFTPKEVASQLGISEHTVRAQIAKGMRRCDAHLRRYGVKGGTP